MFLYAFDKLDFRSVIDLRRGLLGPLCGGYTLKRCRLPHHQRPQISRLQRLRENVLGILFLKLGRVHSAEESQEWSGHASHLIARELVHRRLTVEPALCRGPRQKEGILRLEESDTDESVEFRVKHWARGPPSS